MAKETCSIRLDGELKSDLDKLLKYNGQSLGHLVNVEMSFMLIELIDDYEHQMRDNRRQHYFTQTLQNYLKTADPKKNPKLFPGGSKEPVITEDLLDGMDMRTDLGKALTLLAYEIDSPLTKERLIQIQNELEKEFWEIEAFLRVADSFESITHDGCVDWVNESGFLKKEVRERLIQNNRRNENYEDRLEKIQRRHWFPHYKEMWNGTKPVTPRFLNQIYRSFR